MAALEGYNIAFKIGNKTLAGRTQDDLTIAARTKESLTKDDQGATQVAVIGNALKTGSQAVLAFKYMPTGGQAYGGNCVITNYSESSNSSDEATYTVDFRVTGDMTTTT